MSVRNLALLWGYPQSEAAYVNEPLIVDGSDGEKGVFEANCGIIGLAPYDEDEGWEWPTEGYDGYLCTRGTSVRGGNQEYFPDSDAFQKSGHTREEWLALADAMIERWKAWRSYITLLSETPS